MKTGKLFMAFAKGQESTEGSIVKRYVGVAPCFIQAVNPNRKEMEALYNTTLEKDPEYLSAFELDGVNIPSVRIDFIVKTDPEKSNGIEMQSKVAFFLRKEYRYNRDKSKVQVIDKYGRTAWVTIAEAQAHQIPVYSTGPANLDVDYRPCYVGEEELTNFIKAYLNIPNVMKYVNNSWKMVDNPQDCEARLERIDSYFNEDFSELKEVINLQPNNKVKLLFGVRTNDEGKMYQSVYTQMPLKNGVTDYSKLSKDLEDRKAAGAYPSTTFEVCPLKEFTVTATDLANAAAPSPMPVFANPFDTAPSEVGMNAVSPWNN